MSRELAIKAAYAGGEIVRKYFRKDLIVEEKPDETLVTQADKESEQAILAVLQESGYAVLSEESGALPGNEEYTWVVDPIDGTSNFARGIPLCCITVALMKGQNVILGVLYDVLRDEMYAAEKGRGVTRNEQPMDVLPPNQKPCIAVDFVESDLPMKTQHKVKEKFAEGKGWSLREFGCAALGTIYACAGHIDGFIGYGQQLWDYASGALMAKEQGLFVLDWDGNDWVPGKRGMVICRPEFKDILLSAVYGERP